jgi:uncharacterized phage-associated protein
MPEQGRLSPKLSAVLARLCERLGPLYTTQAVKLPYLVDVVANHVLGRSIAGGTYEAWEHGVVTREVFRFVKYEDPGPVFRIEQHAFSESGKRIALAGRASGAVLTAEEVGVVDLVAQEYGRLPVEQLGHLTKRLNTEIRPDGWGTNRRAAIDEDAYLRLSPGWQDLCERIATEDLDDRSRWSEPIQKNPKAHFRRLLNG